MSRDSSAPSSSSTPRRASRASSSSGPSRTRSSRPIGGPRPATRTSTSEIDAETGRSASSAPPVVAEIEDPTTRDDPRRGQGHPARCRARRPRRVRAARPRPFGGSTPRPPSRSSCSACARPSATPSFDQFASREGELITGTVSRVEPRAIILDVGKAPRPSSPPPSSRPPSTTASASTSRRTCSRSAAPRAGPQIYVSRTHKGFLRRLFELEVPEIHAGTVEIKAIAREAGSRSQGRGGVAPGGPRPGRRHRRPARRARPGGRRGARRREDRRHPVERTTRPFRRQRPQPGPGHGRPRSTRSTAIANVTVPERMLSLAIGREGQNARLAAKLTGWRIDIRSDAGAGRRRADPGPSPGPRPPRAGDAAPEAVVGDRTPVEAPRRGPARGGRRRSRPSRPRSPSAPVAPRPRRRGIGAGRRPVAAAAEAKPKRATRKKATVEEVSS